ncbi:DUF2148 domain-containing protein [Methanoregula sp.]|uniref:ferredoxin domain-containing protein n=1 Tax=Methanoregula sp. TaxID=2052170 RepID=UPI00236AAB70|nr:DUF2148 domain-containing protein [Methanoregula sp.]MDD1686001.1 DUF2148 domain-containing protein [Methanoregula sp.]
MTPEQNAVKTVAELMALAARTAPKGKGEDTLEIRVLTKKETDTLATRLENLGGERNIGFFIRDARNLAASDACVLIGSRGNTIAGINCGGCGYPTCAEFEKARKGKKKSDTPYDGPNCVIRMADLGIAVGSAVKTAQIHNVDNRVMYSAGVAARDLKFLPEECTVVYAIPLSATGKNIFFDRPSSHG